MKNGRVASGGNRGRGTRVLSGLAATLMLVVLGLAGPATVAGAAGGVPDAPTGLAPNAVTAGPNPTLTWDAVPGAASYKVTYPNSSGSNQTSTVYAPSYSPTSDFPTGSVTWSVTAYNSANQPSTASTATFINSAFATPNLSCPSNPVHYPAQAPTFTWSSIPGIKTYTLLVSTSSTFVPASTKTYKTQATSYTLNAGQADNQVYYAQLSGTSTGGKNTLPSTSCSYKVVWNKSGSNLNDATPVLLSPSNGASVRDVVLQWRPMAGAARYEVEVSPNGDWANNLLYDIVTDSTTWSPAKTLNNASYFWRVRGTDNAGNNSQWSDSSGSAWQFNVVPLAAPQLISPYANPTSPTVKNANFKLSWTPVPGAGAYEIQVSDNVGFAGVGTSQSCFTTHTDWSPYTYETPPGTEPGPASQCPLNQLNQSTLTGATTLYWHVRAIDNYTQGETADPWSTSAFTQTNKPPSNVAFISVWSTTGRFFFNSDAPSQVSPPNGASVPQPTMSWTAVDGAEYYEVRYTANPWGWDSGTSTCTAPTGTGSSYVRKTMAHSYTPNLASYPRISTHPQCPVNVTWSVDAVDHSIRTSPLPYASAFKWTGFATQPGTPSSTVTIASPSPSDGASVRGVPTFAWNPVKGADHYQLLWFDNPLGSVFQTMSDYNLDGTTWDAINETFTPVQQLPVESGAWQVVALDSSNTVIATSARQGLTVLPPLPVTITGYSTNNANGSTTTYGNGSTIGSTPLITWAQNADVSYYRVFIAIDPDFTNVLRVFKTEQNSIRPIESLPDNQAGQSYYVFVQPVIDDWLGGTNSTGTIRGEYNSTVIAAQRWSFQKQSPSVTGLKVVAHASETATASPGSTNACDDGTNVTTFSDAPTFCWNANSSTPYHSADIGPMSYHIQVATDALFTNLIDEAWVDQASYTPYQANYNNYSPGSTATSVHDRTYPDGPIYWRVQTIDASKRALTYSATGSYTKNSDAPTITGPSDGATVSSTPSLTWTARSYFAQYNVQVFKNGDSAFSDANKIFDQNTDLSSITPSSNNSLTNGNSLPAGNYVWRIRGIDAGGNSGAWSYKNPATNTPYGFTVQPVVPTLQQPTNASVHTTFGDFVFNWTPVPGAVTYRLLVGTGNPPSTGNLVNITTVSTSWSLDRALANGAWNWQVVALDGQGQTLSTSTINSFTYDGSRPNISGQTVAAQDRGALLNWVGSKASSVGSITSYTLTITDTFPNPDVVTTATVNPNAAVAIPGTGGGGGNTVCNSTGNCTYSLTGLTNNHNYKITITPNDANGPGTVSGTLSVTPQAYAPFSSQTNCIKRLYSDLEGVTNPTSSQINVFINYMNTQNKSCVDVAAFMWQSGPFQDLFPIARLYQAYFLRIPDFGGLDYWIGMHRTRGVTTAAMSEFFVQSQEFIDTYGSLSNAGYVALIYQNVLQRQQDPGGYSYWLNLLNTGRINRGQLMLLFSESQEYRDKYMPTIKAELLVLEFLRRTPTQAEVDYYKSMMTPAGTNVPTYDGNVYAQIQAIMATPEYKSRAN